MENVTSSHLYSLDFLNDMPNLEEVSFKDTYLRPGIIKSLNLKNLKSFDLSYTGLNEFGGSYPNLSELSAYGLILNPAILIKIKDCCPKLEFLIYDSLEYDKHESDVLY